MEKNFKSYTAIGLTVAALAIGGMSVYAAQTENAVPAEKSIRIETRAGIRFNKPDYSTLVEKGIIDQGTADKMTAFLTKSEEEMKAKMEEARALMEAGAEAAPEKVKTEIRINIFDEMVKEGILTEAQAEAIKAEMPKPEMGAVMGRMMLRGIATESLVKEGVIDQAAADKITAFEEKKAEEMKAQMEAFENMTEAERKAQFENGKMEIRVDLFEEMVKEGVITQAQADAIKAASPIQQRVRLENKE